MTGPAAQHLPEAVLRPVRGHHAFEACVEQLATAIRLGVYPRGTTLPSERELAERLNVSRATLREAMAALREAGLVETTRGPRRRHRGDPEAAHPVRARGGADHSPRKRRDWLDALEFRRVVEPGAAQLAAPRQPTDERRRAAGAGAHRRGGAPASLPTHRQADSRFHLTVAALTDSPRLIEAVTSVQATLHEMLLAIPVLEANIAHSDRQHAPWSARSWPAEPDRARRAMEEHCDDTAALLRGLVG